MNDDESGFDVLPQILTFSSSFHGKKCCRAKFDADGFPETSVLGTRRSRAVLSVTTPTEIRERFIAPSLLARGARRDPASTRHTRFPPAPVTDVSPANEEESSTCSFYGGKKESSDTPSSLSGPEESPRAKRNLKKNRNTHLGSQLSSQPVPRLLRRTVWRARTPSATPVSDRRPAQALEKCRLCWGRDDASREKRRRSAARRPCSSRRETPVERV